MNSASLKVLFVGGFGPIISDPLASKSFYVSALRLPLEERAENPDYLHTEKLDGVRHFALWPLKDAAQSCFGRDAWPADVPAPSAWLEFDNVKDVYSAMPGRKRLAWHDGFQADFHDRDDLVSFATSESDRHFRETPG